jgi:hypothetical protein
MLIGSQLLWAQKVWGFALPRIIEGDQDAKGVWSIAMLQATLTFRAGKDRLVYLTAFSALLPLVPASLLLADLQAVSETLSINSLQCLCSLSPCFASDDAIDPTSAASISRPPRPRTPHQCNHRSSRSA